MIYPYEVKFNGEYYEAGEEVPEEATEENGTYSEKYTKTEINISFGICIGTLPIVSLVLAFTAT